MKDAECQRLWIQWRIPDQKGERFSFVRIPHFDAYCRRRMCGLRELEDQMRRGGGIVRGAEFREACHRRRDSLEIECYCEQDERCDCEA